MGDWKIDFCADAFSADSSDAIDGGEFSLSSLSATDVCVCVLAEGLDSSSFDSSPSV